MIEIRHRRGTKNISSQSVVWGIPKETHPMWSQTIFIIKCYLHFFHSHSLSSSTKTTYCNRLNKGKYKNLPISFKSDIKSVCKNIKQCHSSRYFCCFWKRYFHKMCYFILTCMGFIMLKLIYIYLISHFNLSHGKHK